MRRHPHPDLSVRSPALAYRSGQKVRDTQALARLAGRELQLRGATCTPRSDHPKAAQGAETLRQLLREPIRKAERGRVAECLEWENGKARQRIMAECTGGSPFVSHPEQHCCRGNRSRSATGARDRGARWREAAARAVLHLPAVVLAAGDLARAR